MKLVCQLYRRAHPLPQVYAMTLRPPAPLVRQMAAVPRAVQWELDPDSDVSHTALSGSFLLPVPKFWLSHQLVRHPYRLLRPLWKDCCRFPVVAIQFTAYLALERAQLMSR